MHHISIHISTVLCEPSYYSLSPRTVITVITVVSPSIGNLFCLVHLLHHKSNNLEYISTYFLANLIFLSNFCLKLVYASHFLKWKQYQWQYHLTNHYIHHTKVVYPIFLTDLLIVIWSMKEVQRKCKTGEKTVLMFPQKFYFKITKLTNYATMKIYKRYIKLWKKYSTNNLFGISI